MPKDLPTATAAAPKDPSKGRAAAFAIGMFIGASLLFALQLYPAALRSLHGPRHVGHLRFTAPPLPRSPAHGGASARRPASVSFSGPSDAADAADDSSSSSSRRDPLVMGRGAAAAAALPTIAPLDEDPSFELLRDTADWSQNSTLVQGVRSSLETVRLRRLGRNVSVEGTTLFSGADRGCKGTENGDPCVCLFLFTRRGDDPVHAHEFDTVKRTWASEFETFVWTEDERVFMDDTGDDTRFFADNQRFVKALWHRRQQFGRGLEMVVMHAFIQRHATSLLSRCDWFLKADSDTYINRRQMVPRLRQLDAAQPTYYGVFVTERPQECAATRASVTRYATGGPGYAVSRALYPAIPFERCLQFFEETCPAWLIGEDIIVGHCVRYGVPGARRVMQRAYAASFQSQVISHEMLGSNAECVRCAEGIHSVTADVMAAVHANVTSAFSRGEWPAGKDCEQCTLLIDWRGDREWGKWRGREQAEAVLRAMRPQNGAGSGSGGFHADGMSGHGGSGAHGRGHGGHGRGHGGHGRGHGGHGRGHGGHGRGHGGRGHGHGMSGQGGSGF